MQRMREAAVTALLASAVCAALPAALAGADRRPITEKDILKFVWIADPQISPDGSQIVFVRVTANEETDGYETSLFVVPASGAEPPRRLTSGVRDTSPRWSPDGRRLAFVRSVEKDGKPQAGQIHVMPMDGGEARALTDLPKGASQPAWSPDGQTIAFASTTRSDDLKKKEETDKEPGAGRDQGAKKDTRATDVRVITRAVYRANGPGYLDPTRHTHIWTVAASAAPAGLPQPRQITSGDFDESNLRWAPDGSRLYFTSNRVAEPYYEPQDSDLYAVPKDGGDIVTVGSIDGTIGHFAFSPDGTRIAFVGSLHGKPVRSYSQPDLFVTDAVPGSTPRNLTAAYDFDIGGGISADQHAPRGGQPSGVIWSRDGASLLAVSAEHGRANLKRVSIATGKVDPFADGDQETIAYTASADNSKIAALISTATSIGDLFVADATRSAATLAQVTRVNDELFSTLALSAPEEIWYTSFDGRKIQGWILKPPDFDASKKYPLILEIHGGPHAAYGYSFTHEFLWMAAKGYVVLYTNPRGSTSYGQDFGNLIQFHYPGDDFKDLMAGVDEVLARGYVDDKRLGVTGGSGGGVLTNWTITHTSRFAAAVSQRSIADWSGFWFTADFTLFQPTWFRAAPWEDPADFAERSSITHVAKVTTPLMLVEGEADMRTPPADGGEMMFRALKYLKKPVVMVRFPDETHELSRSGKPWHRTERLQHIVGWFDKYLQGKKVETYDVQ